ncbi:hypothetical protein ACROYT_G017766 [Oculina patagonica]
MEKEIKILNYRELNIQRQLGRGAYGTVYLVHCDEPEVTNPVVMKVMHELVAMGDVARKLFMKEAKLLAGLRHENIVQMYGICVSPLAIILEYVVFDFTPFKRNVKVNTSDKALLEIAQMPKSEDCGLDCLIPAIAADVTKGLSHLHQHDVAHRDLKPANILISNQHYYTLQDKQQMERIKAVRPVVCKLADFGESRSKMLQTNGLDDPSTKDIFRGTIPFMAPEILLPERAVKGKKFSLDDLKENRHLGTWACILLPNKSRCLVPIRGRNELPLRQRTAANRHEGTAAQPSAQMLSGNPARTAADQWYAGTQGERALKYVFDNFTNIADSEVKMNRKTDTQDVTLNFEHQGQHLQVTFPYNFPRSNASLITSGGDRKVIAGDTIETAVSAIINCISSARPQAQLHGNPARMATDQWYAGEQGEAALKHVFDKFANIADGEVKMSRQTDTQDVTLSFEHRGREWQVAFPYNFPSSNARLTTYGEVYTRIGGDTLKVAVRAMINHISSLNQRSADMHENASPQWYVGEEGEATLKYIFDKLRSIAESEVKMSRKTDTQDLTLSFHHEGQDWQVKFPSNFPRSNASLSTDGEFRAVVGGDNVKTAVNEMINHILDNPANRAVIQWYTGEEGEAALKYIFDELRDVADGNVKMSRKTDTQDVTLRFQRHGQDWEVKFPSNFPRSSASLFYNGDFYAMVGGNTVEKAIDAVVNRIS